MKKQMQAANVDDKTIAHQQAIIFSMTPKERRNPKILNARRRKRIAAGSGTSVPEVNRLLKQHLQMSTMMKKMGKMGMKGQMQGAMPGMPNMPSPFPPGRG